MGDITYKKVAKKKLFGLTKAALDEIEREIKDTGKNQTQVIHDAILQTERFSPAIEGGISDYQRIHGVSRNTAIESLIIEALAAKGVAAKKRSQ